MRRLAIAVVVVWAICTVPAFAAFPGENGKLVFQDWGFNASNLFTVEPGGASLTPLGSGQGPAWSPDGSRIAFKDASGQISVMNADGTGRTTLTTGSGSDPAWSPDGSSIVFARYEEVSECLSLRALFRMDASGEGSGLTPLTSVSGDAHLPRWSPDGSKIAFIRQVWSDASDPPLYCDVFAYPPELMVMNADGTGGQKIGYGDSYDFDWAPDGSKIVYASSELWTIRPDGTDETQLTATSSGPASSEAHPVWSPDGTKIAFESGSHLYVMNADATGVADLVDTSNTPTFPDWQPLNRAPACDGITAHPAELHPANRRLRRVTMSGATDPDGDPLTIEITGVTQDEPVSGPGDRTAPDARTRPDAATLLLRAERDPSEDGRVYRVAVRGSDDRGGACDAEVTVAVRRHKHRAAIDSAPPSYDSFFVP